MRKEAIQMADNGLEMSDYEIKTMYLNAKNKREQAKILADLNACSVDEIKTALRRAGVDQHQLPRISKNMKKEAENMEDGYIKITSMIAEEASENEKIKEFQKVKEENLQETDKIEKANHKLLLENASLKEQLEKVALGRRWKENFCCHCIEFRRWRRRYAIRQKQILLSRLTSTVIQNGPLFSGKRSGI